MRWHPGWLLLAFFACKSGSSSPGEKPVTDGGADDVVVVEAGSDAPTANGPLDCSQDDTDWPMYNHDVCNTRSPTNAGGISTQTAAKLAMKWAYSAAGEISANPIVVGGQIYVGDWGGNMNAIDAATGQAVWSLAVADLAGLTADGGSAPDTVVARATPALTSNALVFGISRTTFNRALSSSAVRAW